MDHTNINYICFYYHQHILCRGRYSSYNHARIIGQYVPQGVRTTGGVFFVIVIEAVGKNLYIYITFIIAVHALHGLHYQYALRHDMA